MKKDDVRNAAIARAVEALVDDLTGRRGLRHAWDDIDDEIREEIKLKWREIIAREVRK